MLYRDCAIRWLLLIILTTITAASHADNQIMSATMAKDWREDIDYLQQQLEKRHINLYHRVSKEAFTRDLDQLKQQLPELTPSSVPLALMRVVKKIGDGHTQFAYWGQTHHHFPLKLHVFDENLYLVAVTPTYKHLLGMRLDSINQHPVDDVIHQLIPILQSVENPYSEMQRLAETITVAEVLQGLNIIPTYKEAEFGFIDEKGTRHNLRFKSLDSDNSIKLAELIVKLPSGFVRNKASLSGVELYLNNVQQTAMIRFDNYPHTGMTAFSEKLCGVFSDKNIRNVIIDLRRNGGGDFFVGLNLAWGLVLCDELDWNNGMYVLTSRATFSAAMSNAVQYRQILNAKLVGEPTGANPVGYQDAGTFTLPNSGWVVMYSKRLYRFQETSTQGVQPDIFIAPTLESLKQGRDHQLEWILEDIRKRRMNTQ
jgi:hypothetical protein